jgi:hypothetical protein
MLKLALILTLLLSSLASAWADLPAEVKRLKADGLENVFALSPKLFSGGSPEGDAGFESLKKLGIKAIISVDGAEPDVARARKFGMRYIHLPHGYDGIGAETQGRLIKAAQVSQGPLFVHCHHGKHRGPAAAAVICMGTGSWTPEQGLDWLRAAGTDTNYAGLFESVRKFEKPAPQKLDAISAEFPEIHKMTGLVSAMVEIDQRLENLKAIQKAGYQTPATHPDLRALNELTLFRENFREAQRSSDAIKRGSDFVAQLRAVETEIIRAEEGLRAFAESSTDLRNIDESFNRITKSCASCHRKYRD